MGLERWQVVGYETICAGVQVLLQHHCSYIWLHTQSFVTWWKGVSLFALSCTIYGLPHSGWMPILKCRMLDVSTLQGPAHYHCNLSMFWHLLPAKTLWSLFEFPSFKLTYKLPHQSNIWVTDITSHTSIKILWWHAPNSDCPCITFKTTGVEIIDNFWVLSFTLSIHNSVLFYITPGHKLGS